MASPSAHQASQGADGAVVCVDACTGGGEWRRKKQTQHAAPVVVHARARGRRRRSAVSERALKAFCRPIQPPPSFEFFHFLPSIHLFISLVAQQRPPSSSPSTLHVQPEERADKSTSMKNKVREFIGLSRQHWEKEL